ncbi:hypothetical protein [Mongoliitalea daihaiensis]|uniref:hypothetical protein n=1 Tax=Mongoliitalea daihaiensis TaxID=2782006 RepID=UPI001F3C7C29|nr:hypothetical protein [Mongoliitalea daihaiensis]UJP66472.1 hypothetical protein IPZ59_07695 [Mongoliitalea daihaiensis]
MKLLSLIISLLIAITFSSAAQVAEDIQLIDVNRDWFSGWNTYSVKGQEFNFKELEPVMAKFPDSKEYMEIAKKRKRLGIPLAFAGLIGISTAAFLTPGNDNISPVFWPSFGALVLGSGFISSYFVNQQRAVNAYNQQIFRSVKGTASLELQLSPLKSGVALRF